MANFKITRAIQKIFAGNSASDELAAFGTMQTGSPVYTDNVEVLQNSDYEEGWAQAVANNNAPFLEEMNAVQYGFAYQLAYLLQNGVPEYSENETYFSSNYCQYNGLIYQSQSDENIGNNPANDDGTNWAARNFMEIATDAQAAAGLLENVAINPKQLETVNSNLQSQIDTITASSDVTDIVGTYAQLEAYDTSSLQNNDIVKVLQDEEHDNETTYYRWVVTDGVGTWSLIGEEGPYYTIASADNTFVSKTQFATDSTTGIVQAGNGLDVDNNGIMSVNVGDLNAANTSLSNLSTAGNSKLQYAPFSINNGTMTNGINSTLSYSDSVLTCAPCTITTADGRTAQFLNSSTLDCSALANGKYKVFIDVEGNLSTSTNLTISKTEPSSPSTGDYWLDHSQLPLSLKTYDGADWVVDNDKVYLGSVTVSSGVITNVFNVDFNVVREGEFFHLAAITLFQGVNIAKNSSQTVDLSSILPDDGFEYMVFFRGYAATGATTGNGFIYILNGGISDATLIQITTTASRAQAAGASLWLPVTNRRAVTVRATNLAGGINNATLMLAAYYRKGII